LSAFLFELFAVNIKINLHLQQLLRGALAKKAKAEIIPDEPDPDNAGVGKRILQLFLLKPSLLYLIL